MSDEIKLTEVEVKKINLEDGDVLIATIYTDIPKEELAKENVRNAADRIYNILCDTFSNNQVLLFCMNKNDNIEFIVEKRNKHSEKETEDDQSKRTNGT